MRSKAALIMMVKLTPGCTMQVSILSKFYWLVALKKPCKTSDQSYVKLDKCSNNIPYPAGPYPRLVGGHLTHPKIQIFFNIC
jgi:hypothetical protein